MCAVLYCTVLYMCVYVVLVYACEWDYITEIRLFVGCGLIGTTCVRICVNEFFFLHKSDEIFPNSYLYTEHTRYISQRSWLTS